MKSNILLLTFSLIVGVHAYASDPCAGKVAYCSDHTGLRVIPNADSCNYYADSAGLEAAGYCSLPETSDDDVNKCGSSVAYCTDHTGFRAFPGFDSCNYYSDLDGLEVSPYCSK